MYQILPLGIVTPHTRAEVLQVIRETASKNQVILARGAGTSLTGQSVNEAVVLDFSKHFNQVLELNEAAAWVRVEPGIVCAELNAYLKPHGLCFAPDPATENRATIGGMIASNSAGMRSAVYGMTIDHVLALELVLADGEVITFESLDAPDFAAKSAQSTREGVIHRGVRELIEKHREEIRQRYPKVIRRSSGYALDALIDGNNWNLAKLICGSEGTLGVILEAKLKLTPLPEHSALCLAHFTTLDASLRAAVPIVQAGASAAELIDGIIIKQARVHPLTRDICKQIEGDPASILIIELQGNDAAEVQQQAERMAQALARLAYAVPVINAPSQIHEVWQMRSSALGLMTTLHGSKKPTPYIEDAAVPPGALADYVAEVLAICKKHDQPVSLFGHASVGLVHIRPLHDLHVKSDIAQMKQIQTEVFPLVKKYGGSWSGEHGDGIVRGAYNREFFGEALYQAFGQIKALFDPDGRMNPGKIIAPPPMDSHLRFGAGYQPLSVKTRFHYRDHGNILAAVEQCSGVGACRKTLSGVMCPSYMATRDELHSTRGRANALRLTMTGQLGSQGLASPELAAVMKLCLACTGCKGECPNGVDMARLKAEVLQAQQEKNGINLRTRLFANLPTMGRFAAGSQAKFINPLLNNRFTRLILEYLIGIHPQHQLPTFAKQRLSQWFATRDKPTTAIRKVVLFNDTYTEYFLPEVGRAAIECLEAGGYQVILATLGDSQRTAISLGLLDKAKQKGLLLFKELATLLDTDTPILVCEPSCASALIHDLPDLLDDEALAAMISMRVTMIDTFIEQELAADSIEFNWKKIGANEDQRHFLIHSHCHQKTLDGGRWTHKLLQRIPSAVVIDTNAGCCGMAGSFGYEKEHTHLSLSIAKQRLLPAIKKAPPEAIVVSNGFSCRHQINNLSHRVSRHVIEVLRAFIL
ncbi:MAG: FAD-linked oxidase C-terminal domain-containing protein [Thiothrix sp.]|uniref:FAD-binding and (Fe-S)-binding domain-containing protein n=1 Tax=Thiothrix sp. TaxID=1032 RepID=UPI002610EDAB|nr:FAD-binding and (Fe-S)-binding domain-containing protein [Thiothrix sp.]MDD5392908.1 FAD-linked oxidase C-terminal domain-containing protein [Thiothrix sp.]